MDRITQIGKHRVMCSDVMTADINELLEGRKVTVLYSDPPWGAGNLKYWQTINRRQTGAEIKEVNLDRFLNRIFQIIKDYVREVALVEYGIRWYDEIKEYAKKYGLFDWGTIGVVYGSERRPMYLHLFTLKRKTPLPKSYIDSIRGTTGYDTVTKALKPLITYGTSILDPCCGMGYTARAARELGAIFYGNEMNAYRLQKTIRKLK